MSHIYEDCKRPRFWLSRFAHRVWICTCGQGWTTYSYMGLWSWRKWPREDDLTRVNPPVVGDAS